MRLSLVLKGGILLGSIALLGVGCPQLNVPPPPPQSPVTLISPAPPTGIIDRVGTQATPVSIAPVSTTAAGFSPSTMTVAKGTTVTFQNADTKPHWVASKPHPVHTGLPGFDAGAPIPPGQGYSFTFNETGTFGYHDHLNPGTQGQIVVQ